MFVGRRGGGKAEAWDVVLACRCGSLGAAVSDSEIPRSRRSMELPPRYAHCVALRRSPLPRALRQNALRPLLACANRRCRGFVCLSGSIRSTGYLLRQKKSERAGLQARGAFHKLFCPVAVLSCHGCCQRRQASSCRSARGSSRRSVAVARPRIHSSAVATRSAGSESKCFVGHRRRRKVVRGRGHVGGLCRCNAVATG